MTGPQGGDGVWRHGVKVKPVTCLMLVVVPGVRGEMNGEHPCSVHRTFHSLEAGGAGLSAVADGKGHSAAGLEAVGTAQLRATGGSSLPASSSGGEGRSAAGLELVGAAQLRAAGGSGGGLASSGNS